MFYTFVQNNTGGSWNFDSSVAKYIIIEADNAKEANDLAEVVGIYFNGCSEGIDCDCCGDRWTKHFNDSDGTDDPEIYGSSVSNLNEFVMYGINSGQVYAYVYTKNNGKKEYRRK